MSPATPARLRSGRDIATVFRGRQQRGGRLLGLHAQARNDQAPARLAVVASRRVGGAVQRNRAKRLIREGARRQVWRPGFDLVVVARAACADSDLAAVEAELVDLGDQLGVRGVAA